MHAAEGREAEAAKALASLSGCVISYCWRHLKAGHWADLLARTKEGVAAAAVIMEEQVYPGQSSAPHFKAHFCAQSPGLDNVNIFLLCGMSMKTRSLCASG